MSKKVEYVEKKRKKSHPFRLLLSVAIIAGVTYYAYTTGLLSTIFKWINPFKQGTSVSITTVTANVDNEAQHNPSNENIPRSTTKPKEEQPSDPIENTKSITEPTQEPVVDQTQSTTSGGGTSYTEPVAANNPQLDYLRAWDKTKNLNSYSFVFDGTASTKILFVTKTAKAQGSMTVQNGHHSGSFTVDNKENKGETFVYSAPHNYYYDLECHLYRESEGRTFFVPIVFSDFVTGPVREIPSSALNRIKYISGSLTVSLTEEEVKVMYANLIDYADFLSDGGFTNKNIKINSAVITMNINSDGIINNFKVDIQGKAGIKEFSVKGECKITSGR